jgi:iron complex transport system substrate-binding protein
MTDLRVVSLVPGATHAVAALGLRASLVGVTHACGDVADLSGLDVPVLTRSRVPTAGTSQVIDQAVRTAAAAGQAVHVLDVKALEAVRPDVVIAPADRPGGRCPCALAFEDVRVACAGIEPPPRLLTFGPATLKDVSGAVRAVGEALDHGAEAARLAADLRQRVEAVEDRLRGALGRRPRVSLIVWLAPPMGGGGMLAELVQAAGGDPVSGHPTEVVRRLEWAHVVASRPDVIVLAPCGFTLERARGEADLLRRVPGLADTPAARWGQVHVVDAVRWFSSAGACSIRGLEILARLVHPELAWSDGLVPSDLARPVQVE